MSHDGRYFINPLRINGSAIESVFSVLKYASDGNLSGLSYGPALGKLNRKEMQGNKHSEKGYRNVQLNTGGNQSNVTVNSITLSNNLIIFRFPLHVAQSSLGGRQGSNACTLIAVILGSYCMQQNLEISLLWYQLPNIWVNSLVNSVCDGNALYDLYSDTAVLLDVDVVNTVGNELNVEDAKKLDRF